jgi:NADH:ubiquinone oxidoreductase subunit K
MTTVIAVATGLAVFALGVVVLLLRRSLIAVGLGGQMATLGLGLVLGVQGRLAAAVVIVVAGAAVALVVTAAAVAVHRRRGSDHVDELRELRG